MADTVVERGTKKALGRAATSRKVMFNAASHIIVEDKCYKGPSGECAHDVIVAMRDGRAVPVTGVSGADIKAILMRLKKPIPEHFKKQ